MSIPLSLFLIFYIIYLFIFIVFTIFNLWHMSRFGFRSFWAYMITFTYIGLTLIALFISYFYIARVDWSVPFDVFGSVAGSSQFLIGF